MVLILWTSLNQAFSLFLTILHWCICVSGSHAINTHTYKCWYVYISSVKLSEYLNKSFTLKPCLKLIVLICGRCNICWVGGLLIYHYFAICAFDISVTKILINNSSTNNTELFLVTISWLYGMELQGLKQDLNFKGSETCPPSRMFRTV